jgi:hypothetical protein
MTPGREDDQDSKTAPTRSPEGPILTAEQDKLERGGFIARLCHAVIERSTKKATAVVVGITGPWGKREIVNFESFGRLHKGELSRGHRGSL